MYEGMVREKPSSKEEACQFLKGFFLVSFILTFYLSCHIFNSYDVTSPADYSGSHAATVSSVLVTNLKSGVRKGDWDRVEVPLSSTTGVLLLCEGLFKKCLYCCFY